MFREGFHKYDPKHDREKLCKILSLPEKNPKSECWDQTNVVEAIKMLSVDKATSDGLPPEIFKNCGPSLAFHLSLLFRACEAHGYLPPEIAEGTIVPVPKANKDPSKTSSYRPITLGCVSAKIFEACILIQYESELQSSCLQFGFKKNCSTTHCTLTVKGIVDHFTKRGSKVFAALLDATAAYDRANYHKILLRLLNKGLPRSVVRLLLTWYQSTSIKTKFQKNISQNTFGINHSVLCSLYRWYY